MRADSPDSPAKERSGLITSQESSWRRTCNRPELVMTTNKIWHSKCKVLLEWTSYGPKSFENKIDILIEAGVTRTEYIKGAVGEVFSGNAGGTCFTHRNNVFFLKYLCPAILLKISKIGF